MVNKPHKGLNQAEPNEDFILSKNKILVSLVIQMKMDII